MSENSYTEFALKHVEEWLCGIKMRKQSLRCDTCAKPNSETCCQECQTNYCCAKCQKLAWFDHKKWCLGIKHLHDDMQNKNEQKKHIDINEVQAGLGATKLSTTGFDVT